MKLITVIFIEFKLFQNNETYNGLGRIAPDWTGLADPGQVILSPSTWGF